MCCKSLGLPVTLGKQALKEVYVTTFSDFLLASRIDKAREWLKATDMSVEEMAQRLQYRNAQNFSRTFKKAAGLPANTSRKPGAKRSRTQKRTRINGMRV
ncbi:helix-turn-helix domain-containing protein [Paenibacillus filicis]|uniref:Helix-turn-helix domain-containing protein n=1 Tax=Paenibacillus gyeongsangnamensis TaxID=3388067 RepID=A0ABT4QFR2_9BACL|nr:helix-turn-helix domain-containing protein [Paenibacillus filicis]MCZ8515718.1 helix-turn-helix domain-containing protein [Paenibacillus filicis]